MTDDELYSHPYKPYPIQKDLMDAIYDTIELGYKVGLFESPTGTGKTLSLICSTMLWLRDYKRKEASSKTDGVFSDSDEEPEWVKSAFSKSKTMYGSVAAAEYEAHLDRVALEFKNQIQTTHVLEPAQKRTRRNKLDHVNNLNSSKNGSIAAQDSQYIPEDYYSDSEITLIEAENSALAQQVRSLLNKVDSKEDSTLKYVNECPYRIFYSSRTHSQLSQFAHQLKLTNFPSSLTTVSERTKFLPLASRKQLCVNSEVRKMTDISSINDRCLDMQKSKDSATNCQFYPKHKDVQAQTLSRKFADLSMSEIHDIEDLVLFGKSLSICPYYSVRSAVESTEIIALPYQMLLQDTTRDALNLQVDNAIIIIDEAHNLLDVITAINSVSLKQTHLVLVIASLKKYLQKFSRRLNTGNRINLMKLIKLCQALSNYMETSIEKKVVVPGKEIEVDSIFSGSTAESVNIHKLEKFLQRTKIAYKIESYLEDLEPQERSRTTTPLLFSITSFLRSLSNPSKEGRFYWERHNGDVLINYTLLDPSEMFRDIVTRAKCVLLCGGTMAPMSDYVDYLFPYIPDDQIKKFSCGHIVPDENLEVFPIATRQQEFEFLFDKRNNSAMIHDLGLTVLEIAKKTPAGVVAFFPSYKYLNQVLAQWEKDGIFQLISQQKQVFKEPTNSSDVDMVLASYSEAMATTTGSILFSVVGGKMSEGINFSDDMARAVIMVGLPFPNAFSGELVAKRKFIESSVMEKGGTQAEATEKARDFYENICMRAVNQSVGRSIRHIGDYSVIYLIDKRYGSPKIQQKLSGWVQRRLFTKNSSMSLKNALQQADIFFQSKQ